MIPFPFNTAKKNKKKKKSEEENANEAVDEEQKVSNEADCRVTPYLIFFFSFFFIFASFNNKLKNI